MHQSVGRLCFLRLKENKKCKGLNRGSAQYFKIEGPIPSIPAALVGFREDSAPNTSASEISIETMWQLMEESRALASGGKVRLLVVNME